MTLMQNVCSFRDAKSYQSQSNLAANDQILFSVENDDLARWKATSIFRLKETWTAQRHSGIEKASLLVEMSFTKKTQ